MTLARTLAALGTAATLALSGLAFAPAALADEVSEPTISVPAADESAGESPTEVAPDLTSVPLSEITPAQAALVPFVYSGTESFSVSPAGPYTGGQSVTVNFKGWTPGQLVVTLTCPKGVWPATNPPGGGCAPYTQPDNGSNIGVIAPNGTLSLKIKVPSGKLAGTTKSCSNTSQCTFGAYATDSDATPAKTPKPKVIVYKTASTGGSTSTSSGTKKSSTGTKSTSSKTTTGSTTTSSGGETLVDTGAGSGDLAAAGLALLLAGSLMVGATSFRRRGSALS